MIFSYVTGMFNHQKNSTLKSLFRVAVIGPESTGKSTLSAGLAHHFNTLWVPEYARQFIESLDHPYTFDDVLAIARGQVELEDQLSAKAARLLICDTNLIVIRIWLIHKYGRCPEWIDDMIRRRHYDLHLLTDIDIPWISDPQREHPHLREYLFNRYHETLREFGLNYHVISGNAEERLFKAAGIISAHTGLH